MKQKCGWVAENMPYAFCEEAEDVWNYERKESNFICSEDTTEILKIRFGKLRENQKKIIEEIKKQGDRNVTVIYDPNGNNGKSWLSIHLYERGRALVVPRASTTAEKLSAFVCSAYNGEEFVLIDIPRSRPITPELYEVIEELKDGLVYDHRYSGRCRNIRGVKVGIFTNTKLDIDKLSIDRWNPINNMGEPIDLSAIAAAKPTKKRKTKTETNN